MMNSSTFLIENESSIVKIQGVAFLVDADGQQRVLQEGATILPGQSVYVPAGSEVEVVQNGVVKVLNAVGVSADDVDAVADIGNDLDINQILANAITGEGNPDEAPAADAGATGETQNAVTTESMSGAAVLASAGSDTSSDDLAVAATGIGETDIENNLSDIVILDGDSDTGEVTEDDDEDEDNLLEVSGTLSISDPDGDGAFSTTVEFTSSTNNDGSTNASSYGTLIIDADGNWSYEVDNTLLAIQSLDDDETITEVFTVTTADGADTETITITINGTDDLSVVSVEEGDSDEGEVTEDVDTIVEDDIELLTTSGTLTVTDIDTSDTAAFDTEAEVTVSSTYTDDEGTTTSTDSYGTLTITADGEWVYTAQNDDLDWLGDGEYITETFTVTTIDGVTKEITVTVYGTNDAPVANDDGGDTTSLLLTFADDLTNSDSDYTLAYEDGDSHKNGGSLVYTTDDGEHTIEITASNDDSISFTDAGTDSHNGYGIGVDSGSDDSDDSEINDDESITIDFGETVSGNTEIGLSGLGSHFDTDGSVDAEVTWTAYDIYGNEVASGTVVQDDDESMTTSFTVGVAFASITFSVDSDVSSDFAIQYIQAVYLDSTFTTEEDTSLIISEQDILDNDTDVDNAHSDLSIESISDVALDPESGEIVGRVYLITDPQTGETSIEFIPNKDYYGTAEITYTITDGDLTSNEATISIEVTPVDDRTKTTPDTATVVEDGENATGNVLTDTDAQGHADFDVDDELSVVSFTVDTNADGVISKSETYSIDADSTQGTEVTIYDHNGDEIGTLTMLSDGSYTFDPADDWSGDVPTITYTTNTGASDTLDITVTPVADEPELTLTASSSVTRTITADNIDSGALTGVTISASSSTAGTDATVSTVTGTSHDGFGVSDSSLYGNAAESEIEPDEYLTVTLDDAVYSVEVSFAWMNSSEVASYTLLSNGVVVGSGEVSPGSDTVDPSVEITSSVAFDQIVFSGAVSSANNDYLINSITYETSFDYDSSDDSSDSTIQVDEQGSIDLSIDAALTDSSETLTIEISGIPAGYTLVDGDGTEYTIQTDGETVTLDSSWDLSTLSLITPDVDETETFTLTVTAISTESDNTTATTTSSVDIQVNDIVTADKASTDEDIDATGNVLTNDDTDIAVTITSFTLEGDDTEYTVESGSSNSATVYVNGVEAGTITMDYEGNYTFDPADDWNGDVPTITYTTNTGTTATLDITVNAVNDAPTTTDGSASTIEDTSVILELDDFGSYSDVEDDALSYIKITSLPTDGTLEYYNSLTGEWELVSEDQEISASDIESGYLRFTPDSDYSGDVTFAYQVSDGTDYSVDSYTMTISVAADADAPTLVISTDATETQTINANNIDDTSGVDGLESITAYTSSTIVLDSDGNVISFDSGTDTGDIVIKSNKSAFGVTADSNDSNADNASGDYTELGFTSSTDNVDGTETVTAESIVVALDYSVSSVDVEFEWLNGSEEATYILLDDEDNVVDSGTVSATSSGSTSETITSEYLFSTIVFTATGSNYDYLIESISYDTVAVVATDDQDGSITIDEQGSVSLNIAAAATDYDGSETVTITVTVPDGFEISDGTDTATSTDGVVDITDWDLDNLTLTATTADETVTDAQLVVSVTSTDGSDTSTVSSTIDITVNDVIDADTGKTNEDTTLEGNVLTNDLGDDLTVSSFSVMNENGEMVTYLVGSDAQNVYVYDESSSSYVLAGAITVSYDGNYIFTPAENWNGDVPTITYTTNTGATSTLDITVNAVNDAPEISIETVSANDNMLINPSFEVNSNNSDGVSMTTLATGWVTGNNDTIETWSENWSSFESITGSGDAPDGSYIMELDQYGNNVDYISQTVSTEAGETYTLTFSAMARVDLTSDFEVYWGDTLVASTDSQYSSESNYTGDVVYIDLSTDSWTDVTISLTGGGSDTTLTITELDDQDNGSGALLDNFSLTLDNTSDSTNINETTTDDEVILTVSGTDIEDDATGTALAYAVYTDSSLETLSTIFEIDDTGNLTLVDGVDLTTLDTIDSYEIYIVAIDSDGATSDPIDYTINIVRDAVEGTDSADTLYGGDSDDSIAGGDGNDKLYGEDGDDNLYGEAGKDKLFGGSGDDNLFGGDGNDTLKGGSGDDNLYGGDGNDTLKGGSGDDNLYGGTGNDILTGGTGNDIFTWVQTTESQSDTVKDFTINTMDSSAENDVLDISDLLDGTDYNGSNLDDYLSVSVDDENDQTVLTVDLDGDGDVDTGNTVTITLDGWDSQAWTDAGYTDSYTSIADFLEQNGNLDVD